MNNLKFAKVLFDYYWARATDLGPIHYQDIYYYEESYIDTVIKEIRFLKYDSLSEGDRVLFTFSSQTPRYKFREFGNENGLIRTIRPNNATAVIVDTKKIEFNIKNYTQCDTYYISDIEYWKTQLTPEFTERNPRWLDKLESEIVKREENIILFSTNQNTIDKIETSIRGKLDLSSLERVSLRKLNHQDQKNKVMRDYETIHTLNGKVKFIDDKDLIKVINKGGDLDEDMIKVLGDMLKSKDESNISLAMNIMSDCNYENNELKIARLISENRCNMKLYAYRSWNLVNFKSLIKYLDSQKIPHDNPFQLDAYIGILKKKNKVESSSVEIV